VIGVALTPMNSRSWARAAVAAVAVFLILLSVLHVIEPELDPSTRLISEYELGRYGWLMSVAFFSLGAGVLATSLSTWDSLTIRSGLIGRWWLLMISAALFGAGCFYPYQPPTLASYIHGVCGVIVIVTFPIAASFYSLGLVHSAAWSGSPARLRWVTVFVWVGLVAFLGSVVVLGITSGPVDRSDPALLLGWQNRFMIVTYSVWVMVVTWPIASRPAHTRSA
jgi:hypothetical protein